MKEALQTHIFRDAEPQTMEKYLWKSTESQFEVGLAVQKLQDEQEIKLYKQEVGWFFDSDSTALRRLLSTFVVFTLQRFEIMIRLESDTTKCKEESWNVSAAAQTSHNYQPDHLSPLSTLHCMAMQ